METPLLLEAYIQPAPSEAAAEEEATQPAVQPAQQR
jgi:hypothetical protein